MTARERQPPVERDRLAAHLDDLIARGRTQTYREAARALGLEPPHTIHRLTVALEDLTTADARAGRPLRAAAIVSRAGNGLPAAGFFAHARALGVYDGPETGAPARAFHRDQLERLGIRPGR